MSEVSSQLAEYSCEENLEEIPAEDDHEITTVADLPSESQEIDLADPERFVLTGEFLTCENGQWRVAKVTVLPDQRNSRFLYEDFLCWDAQNFNVKSKLVQKEILKVPEQFAATQRRSEEIYKTVQRNPKRITKTPKKFKSVPRGSSELSMFVLVSGEYLVDPDDSTACSGDCQKIKPQTRSESYKVPVFSVDLPVPGHLFINGLGEDGQRRLREFTITKEDYNPEETSCPELVASIEECCCDCVCSDPVILYDCEVSKAIFEKFCRSFYVDGRSCRTESACEQRSLSCSSEGLKASNDVVPPPRLYKEYHGDLIYLAPEFREGIVVNDGPSISQLEKEEILKISADGFSTVSFNKIFQRVC